MDKRNIHTLLFSAALLLLVCAPLVQSGMGAISTAARHQADDAAAAVVQEVLTAARQQAMAERRPVRVDLQTLNTLPLGTTFPGKAVIFDVTGRCLTVLGEICRPEADDKPHVITLAGQARVYTLWFATNGHVEVIGDDF